MDWGNRVRWWCRYSESEWADEETFRFHYSHATISCCRHSIVMSANMLNDHWVGVEQGDDGDRMTYPSNLNLMTFCLIIIIIAPLYHNIYIKQDGWAVYTKITHRDNPSLFTWTKVHRLVCATPTMTTRSLRSLRKLRHTYYMNVQIEQRSAGSNSVSMLRLANVCTPQASRLHKLINYIFMMFLCKL